MDAPVFPSEEDNQYSGISGWLAFLTLGVFVSSILLLIAIVNNLRSSQYAQIYHNSWLVPTFLIWDAIYLVIYCMSVYLILKRKKIVIRILKHALWTFALINVFLVNAQMIDANKAVANGTISKAFADSWTSSVGSTAGRSILAAVIWIPYLRRSKRVKATLIN